MFGLALSQGPRRRQKISTSLQKIAQERTPPSTSPRSANHELVITGMSQLHLDVVQHRLKRRFELEMITKEPKNSLPGDVTTPAEASHSPQEKQTGAGDSSAKCTCASFPIPRDITTKSN